MGRVGKKMNQKQIAYLKAVIIKYITAKYKLDKTRRYSEAEIYSILAAIPKAAKNNIWTALAEEVRSTATDLAKFFHHFFQKALFPQPLDKTAQTHVKQFVCAHIQHQEAKLLADVCTHFPEIHPKRLKAFAKTYVQKIKSNRVLYKINMILQRSAK